MKGMVVKVEGRIQDNQLKGESRVCLIIIPDGVSIKDAAQELTELNKEPSEQGAGIELAKNKGFAYYGSPIAASYFGGLTHTAYVPNLDRTKQYKAYLGATSRESAQWVVYSEKGIDVKFPLTGAAATQVVEMIDAKAERDIAIQPQEPIKFELGAKFNAKQAGFQGGFLLIKQGTETIQPDKVLVKLLQENKSLPQGEMLKKLDVAKDVLSYTKFSDVPFVSHVGDLTLPNIVGHDEHNTIFERGATYQVYGYLVDGQHNYFISTENKSILIPRAEAELEMKKVGFQTLVANMSTMKIGNLELGLTGNITKHQGTVHPYLGFLFVKGAALADTKTVIARIKSLITAGTLVVNSFKKDANTIVYTASEPGKDVLGEQDFSGVEFAASGLELGESYMVYCWLQDGSEVFVSDNSLKLELPNIKGKITKVKSRKNAGENQALVIDLDQNIVPGNFFNEASSQSGYFFSQDGQPNPDINHFRGILDNARAIDKAREDARKKGKDDPGDPDFGKAATHDVGNTVFWKTNFDKTANFFRFFEKHGPFSQRVKYKVYVVMRSGNALFYSDAGNELMQTYTDFVKTEPEQVLADPDGDANIRYTFKPNPKYEIWHENIADGTLRRLNKNNALDKALIDKVILKAIEDTDVTKREEDINDFINNMK
jgi:hypothetical protein